VKKILLSALAALGGALLWRKVRNDRAEQQLWSEATDPITPPRLGPS
jgi:hypothetical protein